MNVFDVKKGKLVGSLIAENDVQSVAFYAGGSLDGDTSGSRESQEDQDQSTQVLAAVTRDGMVELFPRPFQGFEPAQLSGTSSSLKTKRKQMTRKAEALVKISRPNKSATVVHVIDTSFEEAELVMAWTEGGVNVVFERARWKDESNGGLLWKGMKEIVRGKSGSGLGATVMNGVKDLGKSKVDESQTVVVNGGDLEDVEMKFKDQEVIDVSSGSDEPSDEDARSESEGEQHKDTEKAAPDRDEEMKDAEHDDDQVEDPGEATFGELVRANAPEAIDVSAAFVDAEPKTLVQSSADRSLQLPSGMSLGTVLTQSLRTNDTTLLETCFHTTDLGTIRATIERLDSALAAALLQKLAERLHNRPGRAGNLMVWIQWTLICHGGYLAGQPELMKKLSSLHRVVKERASSLQPLLSLKGKLDMLEAQMNLRKSMQGNARAAHADEDDEEGVIYVEGQEESDSEADSIEAVPKRGLSSAKRNSQSVNLGNKGDSDSEEEGDDMPTTLNGVIPDSEEDDESASEDGLVDDEASETDEDSADNLSGDEVNHEDIDSAEDDDDEESDVEAPPAKRTSKFQLGNGLFSK
ncbi:MAG: Small subunit (SSU) processome component [Pleopsidium flavum]|nr:MAG: Small subunit (SSU) processome component [Pleopsidium flavum]